MLVRYDRGLLQVSNAIFKYFGLDTYHDIDLQVENWLNEHEFETLIVLLIDGMGSRIIKEILKPNDFLVKYMTKEMPTVFPSTTTAATTAFLTGKSPKETAWLGWSQYFKEVDDSVVLFRNCSLYNDKLYPNFNERLKNKSLMDYLAERNISFKTIYPSWDINGTDNLEEFVQKVKDATKDSPAFIYGYFDQFDACMHDNGPSSLKAKEMLKAIDEQLAMLASSLTKKQGLLILADHGQVDIEAKYLDDYPDILACLKHRPSLEARCISFDIKEGMNEIFEKTFRKYFNEDFALLSHDEAIRMNIFGIGNAHERFEEFIGDYIAIGCTNVSLFSTIRNDKGDHAGSKEKEIMIPLIAYPTMRK